MKTLNTFLLFLIISLSLTAQDDIFYGFPFDDLLNQKVTYGQTTIHRYDNLVIWSSGYPPNTVVDVKVVGGNIKNQNSQKVTYELTEDLRFDVIWNNSHDIKSNNGQGSFHLTFRPMYPTGINDYYEIIDIQVTILFEFWDERRTHSQHCALIQSLGDDWSTQLISEGNCDGEMVLASINTIVGAECCNLTVPEACREECISAQEELNELISNNTLTLNQKLNEINLIKNNNPGCTTLNLRCN